MSHLLRHGTSVFKVISERPVILPSECRALGEGAITTYLGCCVHFVFESHEQFFSYLATVTITGDRDANLDLCLARLLAVRVLLRATPTATRDLRF